MATLRITETTDFSGQVLTNIDSIVFVENPDPNQVPIIEATFQADQFGPGLIANDVTITDSDDRCQLVINLGTAGSFSAENWQFASWRFSNSKNKISINGTSAAETVIGTSQDDWIFGGGGSDILRGGPGSDGYMVFNPGVTVIEGPGEGGGGVATTLDGYVLPDNLVGLLLEGTGNISGFGNAEHNAIVGNSGNNLLDGGGGGDVLEGHEGDDTYIVRDPRGIGSYIQEFPREGTDQINAYVSYTMPAYFENLLLLGSGDLNAWGNSYANVMTGNSGNNIIDGKGGADTMSGSAGNDTYVVRQADDSVVENPGGGTDQINTFITRTLSAEVENLRLMGNGDLNGAGNTLENTLRGNAGNNVLDGKAGSDTMIGGLGDDVFVVDEHSDLVIESAGGGTDQINTFITEGLVSNVENLQLLGTTNISGFGNSLANEIVGNNGGNWLFGMLRNDMLTGRAGQDSFIFNTAPGTDNVDIIVDYSLIDDLIRLEDAVFADAGPVGTLAADAFHVGTAAADGSDRIIYDTATGTIFYDSDGDGATIATPFATITAGLALTNSDFYVM